MLGRINIRPTVTCKPIEKPKKMIIPWTFYCRSSALSDEDDDVEDGNGDGGVDGSCLAKCVVHLSNISEARRGNLSSFSPVVRGGNQKVASFSFYGKSKGVYFEGIKENLDLMRKVQVDSWCLKKINPNNFYTKNI